MKTGILGGSFDPIHNGHIHMAISVMKEYPLDELLLIPAGHSPNKDETQMTSCEHRLAMTRLAAEDANRMLKEQHIEGVIKASDFEIRSEERSYTYRTLEKFHDLYPDHEFYFIMGGDSLDYFEKWYHPEIIAALSTILVVVREGFDREAMEEKIRYIKSLFPCTIDLVSCGRYDISSTAIRMSIKNTKSSVSGTGNISCTNIKSDTSSISDTNSIAGANSIGSKSCPGGISDTGGISPANLCENALAPGVYKYILEHHLYGV